MAAIGLLKLLSEAQSRFRDRGPDGGPRPVYGTLADLRDQGLVPLSHPNLSRGYSFEVGPGSDPAVVWWGIASPAVPGATGERYFVTNQSGTVYYRQKEPFVLEDLSRDGLPSDALPVGASTSPPG